jgi:hypothetical protein
MQTVDAMPAERRSVVIGGAGDRRDEDIAEQARSLSPSTTRWSGCTRAICA